MKTIQKGHTFEQVAFNRLVEADLKTCKFDDFVPSPDTQALIPYNGYYALDCKPGAFFAIDANLVVANGGSKTAYMTYLYFSLDGKTAHRVAFSSGTFDGTTLIQSTNEFSLHLTLTRVKNAAITVKLKGQIAHLPASPTTVSGSTYNNPIENSLYQGTYYQPQKIIINPEEKAKTALTKVMQIGENNTLYYDYGTGDKNLKQVPEYIYNMNMYYFQFPDGEKSVQLIMGTAGALGFACNDMTVDGKKVSSRNLQTIMNDNKINSSIISDLEPNPNSKELGDFSGYYPLPSIHPRAFLSILGQYTVFAGAAVYSASITFSFDGVNSTCYDFVKDNMSFSSNVLTLTDTKNSTNISLTFTKEYDSETMTLAKVIGNINEHSGLQSQTPFNPVPLSAFGGVPMTNTDSSLNITSDLSVTYTTGTNTQKPTTVNMDAFIYVPLMYILANPWDSPTTVLSLGTSKSNGNVSIVIDVKNDTTTFVQAIPDN
ncbi:hypothetical protein [Gallaecimonas sp. GXIMD1310]|uniref:hypothetical protein n=1 Tax=Gallaecimonas sp. GXIMD1310 TaxID=3131926 RepID=UPI00324CD3D8